MLGGAKEDNMTGFIQKLKKRYRHPADHFLMAALLLFFGLVLSF